MGLTCAYVMPRYVYAIGCHACSYMQIVKVAHVIVALRDMCVCQCCCQGGSSACRRWCMMLTGTKHHCEASARPSHQQDQPDQEQHLLQQLPLDQTISASALGMNLQHRQAWSGCYLAPAGCGCWACWIGSGWKAPEGHQSE